MGGQLCTPVSRRVFPRLLPIVNTIERGLVSGVVQVNICFQLAGLLVLTTSRFALYGRL